MKGNDEVSWTLGVSRYRSLLLGGAHPLQEWDERHESFIVSGLAELLHQGRGLLLGPCCPWRPCRWGKPHPWSASSVPSRWCLQSP